MRAAGPRQLYLSPPWAHLPTSCSHKRQERRRGRERPATVLRVALEAEVERVVEALWVELDDLGTEAALVPAGEGEARLLEARHEAGVDLVTVAVPLGDDGGAAVDRRAEAVGAEVRAPAAC